jgi:hypothetical protein
LKIFLLLAAAAVPAAAQEMVSLPSHPGVTQSFFVANMGDVKPRAVALLYIGAGGRINLRTEEGQVKFGQNNFLPRARRESSVTASCRSCWIRLPTTRPRCPTSSA